MSSHTAAKNQRSEHFAQDDDELDSLEKTGDRLGGTCRTKLYHLISEGHLDAVKVNGSTKIRRGSTRRYLANLPKANIRVGMSGRAR